MELLDEYMIDDIFEYMALDKLKIALCDKKYLHKKIKILGEYCTLEDVFHKLTISFGVKVRVGKFIVTPYQHCEKILFIADFDYDHTSIMTYGYDINDLLCEAPSDCIERAERLERTCKKLNY